MCYLVLGLSSTTKMCYPALSEKYYPTMQTADWTVSVTMIVLFPVAVFPIIVFESEDRNRNEWV